MPATSPGRPPVHGKPIDGETRCVHFHSELDVIAIKFKCCGKYYPCFSCHEESAGHPSKVWPRKEWNEVAVLCGVCGHEMTIHQYLACHDECPFCQAPFNPNCRVHYHLYFEQETLS